MVILLNILLGLFTILDGFIIKYVYDDFKGVKDNESYTNSSLWQRIVLNSILAFSIIALSFLATFLVYVICVPMKIG